MLSILAEEPPAATRLHQASALQPVGEQPGRWHAPGLFDHAGWHPVRLSVLQDAAAGQLQHEGEAVPASAFVLLRWAADRSAERAHRQPELYKLPDAAAGSGRDLGSGREDVSGATQ